MKHLNLKIIISLFAIAILLVHHLYPQLQLDLFDLSLIAIIILPWLSELIKGLELPGGFKIEFQELKEAGDKIINENSTILANPSTHKNDILIPQNKDSNYALVYLRIEIEKRLRKLISIYNLKQEDAIPLLLRNLKISGVLNEAELDGLRNIIISGNRALHGVEVDSSAGLWAEDVGNKILDILDSKIKQKFAG